MGFLILILVFAEVARSKKFYLRVPPQKCPKTAEIRHPGGSAEVAEETHCNPQKTVAEVRGGSAEVAPPDPPCARARTREACGAALRHGNFEGTAINHRGPHRAA